MQGRLEREQDLDERWHHRILMTSDRSGSGVKPVMHAKGDALFFCLEE
jgi:hypothetical protein